MNTDRIKSRAKIFVKSDINFNTVKELLSWYFNNHNPPTFYKSGRIQCIQGRNRSFKDIVIMCRTYFPGTSEIDIISAIREINIKAEADRSTYIVNGYCNDVDDTVFCGCKPMYYYPNWKAMLGEHISFIGKSGYTKAEIYKLYINE